MKRFLLVQLMIAMILTAGIPRANALQDAEEYYKQGMASVAENDTVKALELWIQAKGKLEKSSPRIGIDFIRLATEARLEKFYEMSGLIYIWGLEAERVEPYQEMLHDEVGRIGPLVGKDRIKHWNNLIDHGDPAIYTELKGFWKSMDPTPLSTFNERLVEHWFRIAYAKRHFTRNDNSIYGTDPRGPIFVRYGNPDRKFHDHLRINTADVSSMIKQRLPKASRTVLRALEDAVMDYHHEPEYFIWSYDAQNQDMRENLVRIFAEDETGRLREVTMVDQIIPSRAFSMSKRHSHVNLRGGTFSSAGSNGNGTGGITPGLIMQLLYYKQLSTVDPMFGYQYASLDNRFLSLNLRPFELNALGGQVKQEHQHRQIENFNAAPENTSTEEELMAEIPIKVYQYRMLNNAGRPYLVSFMKSTPHDAFLADYKANYGGDNSAVSDDQFSRQMSNYRLIHGLQLYDEDWNLLTQGRYDPPLAVSEGDYSLSMFNIPFVSQDTRQVFAAQLHNFDRSSVYPVRGLMFPEDLRGVGKLVREQPEPLPTDPSVLVMSDPMLGYNKQDSAAAGDPFPFTIAHEHEVPTGEELVLHIEVYHLKRDQNSISDFSISYKILPVNFLGWTQDRKEKFELTLNLQTDTPWYKENLEIETETLEPGRYEIVMTTRDRFTGQSEERKIRFEVVEREGVE